MAERKSLAAKLRGGEEIITAWSLLPVPILAEFFGRSGYEAVTLDFQHGMHDIASVRDGFASLALGGSHRISRIPVDDFATASRLLDMGAEAVIAPMINSRDDAQAFVDFMKYPPIGKRSWGPHRGAMLQGMTIPDYLARANDETLALAMIETPEALSALDDILAVPGLDGVFVGPADLSLTLSNGSSLDPAGAGTAETAARIAKTVRDAGKIAGIFCVSADMVQQSRQVGYQLMAFGSDVQLFLEAAEQTRKSV